MKTIVYAIVLGVIVGTSQHVQSQAFDSDNGVHSSGQEWWLSTDAGLTWHKVIKPRTKTADETHVLDVQVMPDGRFRVTNRSSVHRRWWFEVWRMNGQMVSRSSMTEHSSELWSESGIDESGVYIVRVLADGVVVGGRVVLVVR
jgi:hypothetical protein